jgi:hypothetical protein
MKINNLSKNNTNSIFKQIILSWLYVTKIERMDVVAQQIKFR